VLIGLRSEEAESCYKEEDAWQAILAIIVAFCGAFYLDLRLNPFVAKFAWHL
jgi:hypothetical protein